MREGQRRGGRSPLFKMIAAAAWAGVLTGAPAAWGQAAQPTQSQYEDLLKKVEQLQSRLNDVEKRESSPSTAEVDQTVRQVLSDADRHSQLLADGTAFTAGYDPKKGFIVQSEDGRFTLRPSVQFQFRYTANFNQAGSDDTQAGFEVRRARFRFDGNVLSPDLTYSFVWDTNRAGGAVSLLDAWFQYRFAPQWAVKAGQFKESVFHERDISGYSQIAVDRTLVDAVLGGNLTDRVQGVSLIYGGTKDNNVRAEIAYHDGANSKNTNFQDSGVSFGAGGRVEYKFFGDWADYKDFTAKGIKEPLLIIGAGADFTQRDTGDTALTSADVQWKDPSGWSVYGAIHANYIDPRNTANDDNRVDWGAIAQVAYLFSPKWEAFGRYDIIGLDQSIASGEDTFSEITIGLNHYLGENGSAGHRAKITVDVSYLPDGSPSTQTQVGSFAGGEGQLIARAQFQLLL